MAAARRARSFLALAAVAGLAVGYFGGRFNPPPKDAAPPQSVAKPMDEPPPAIIPAEARAATGIPPSEMSLANADPMSSPDDRVADTGQGSQDDECARAKASPESADADVLRRCGAVVEMEPFVIEARERTPRRTRAPDVRTSKGATDDQQTLNSASPFTQEEMPGRTINFANDSDALPAGGARVLSDIARRLKDDSSMIVRVIGRADDSPDPQVNLEMGMRRANAAAEKLIQMGVPTQQIERVSSGDGPTGNESTGSDASGVEVVILPARPSFL